MNWQLLQERFGIQEGEVGNADLLRKVKILMTLRVIAVTLFWGVILFFQAQDSPFASLFPVSWPVIGVYGATLVYILHLPHVRNLRAFCFLQILGDLILETSILYVTGGVESVFSFLYILSIITASITLQRPGNYTIALLAGLFYLSLACGEFYGLITPVPFLGQDSLSVPGTYILYKSVLNTAAFFLVAFLSDYLSESLRRAGKALEEKSENLANLRSFHENIVQSMSSGLLITQIDGRIVSLNKAAERITGFTLEEVQGKSCYEFFRLPTLLEICRHPETLQVGTLYRCEGDFEKRDGEKIYLGLSISPFRDDRGVLRGLIFIFQDVT
ncbi:MAG: PAS domain-containing protein, partial [Nitrospinota bacterium]